MAAICKPAGRPLSEGTPRWLWWPGGASGDPGSLELCATWGAPELRRGRVCSWQEPRLLCASALLHSNGATETSQRMAKLMQDGSQISI